MFLSSVERGIRAIQKRRKKRRKWASLEDSIVYVQIISFEHAVFMDFSMLALVSLFKGVSSFIGYLRPRPSLLKNSSINIQHTAGGDYRAQYFSEGELVRKWTQ